MQITVELLNPRMAGQLLDKIAGRKLIDVVYACAAAADSHCMWRRPLRMEDIEKRLTWAMPSFIEDLRKASPCFCVVKDLWPACIDCPLFMRDINERGRCHFVLHQLVNRMVTMMKRWDEYKMGKAEYHELVKRHEEQQERINVINMLGRNKR
jgi:hypothetical protein